MELKCEGFLQPFGTKALSDFSEPRSETALMSLESDLSTLSEIDLLPDRLARYADAKTQSRSMAGYLDKRLKNGVYDLDFDKQNDLFRSIESCANFLEFHDYYTTGQVRLSRMFSCKKHLLCRMCAVRRSAKQVSSYLDRLQVIKNQNPDLELWFVTLTIKNGNDLPERFEHLSKSMKKMNNRRRQNMVSGWGNCELAKAKGAVYSYELTKSDHGWHPHVHMLLLLQKGESIDTSQRKNSKLSKEWYDITKDSFIVDSRKVYGDPISSFLEVFKYALKFTSLSQDDNYQAFLYLTRKRLLGSFGLFRGVDVPDSLTDDLIDHLPYIERLYNYTRGSGYSLSTYAKSERINEKLEVD